MKAANVDDMDPSSEHGARFNMIPADRAPNLVLRMLSRFAAGLPEPMVIGDQGQPVAALIPIEDLLRLREYDQSALDTDEAFYAELERRLQSETDPPTRVDLEALTRRLLSPDA